jgi:hypothetical protein
LLAALVSPATAQRLRLGLEGVALTHFEGRGDARSEGGGLGAVIELRLGRFALAARAFGASLEPDSTDRSSYDVVQGDVRLRFAVSSLVALEVGGGRRSVTPELAAQDVGVVRLGLYSETGIGSHADIWARGAYLPVTEFTGGGSASLALEFGLGVAVGTANGRFRASVEYEFQRIDREADGIDVPLQTSLARLGVAVGLL